MDWYGFKDRWKVFNENLTKICLAFVLAPFIISFLILRGIYKLGLDIYDELISDYVEFYHNYKAKRGMNFERAISREIISLNHKIVDLRNEYRDTEVKGGNKEFFKLIANEISQKEYCRDRLIAIYEEAK